MTDAEIVIGLRAALLALERGRRAEARDELSRLLAALDPVVPEGEPLFTLTEKQARVRVTQFGQRRHRWRLFGGG